MNSSPNVGPAKIAVRSENFHRWRSRKDLLARKVIGLGGLVVISAVLLILFYLLFVVAPLFLPASAQETRVCPTVLRQRQFAASLYRWAPPLFQLTHTEQLDRKQQASFVIERRSNACLQGSLLLRQAL